MASFIKRKRSLVSDALKRQGIEVKPSDREVNCLAGRRFEEDMKDDVKGKAKRWAQSVLEGNWLDESGYSAGQDLYDVGVAGFEAGYAEGYEVAQRSAEPIWAQVYWEGFENGRKAAQPRWISVKERLPEEGKLTVIYMPNRIINGEIELGTFENGDWHDWAYDVTHWMPLPPSPKEEK